MKIVSYDPNDIKNVPAFFNKHIYDETDKDMFVMFVYKDLLEAMVDKNAVVNAYQNFMLKFNLPYAFYPYYLHFNKIVTDSNSKECPRAYVNIKGTNIVFDIVSMQAYGMLVLNRKILMNMGFKFNEEYKQAFYIQDLIVACEAKKTWISSIYFIDVHESWKLFSKKMNDGYKIPAEVFLEEKKKFNSANTQSTQSINDFIKQLKAVYGSN